MVEKGKLYYETPCEVCGQFHRGAPVEWDDCDGPGGSRTEVTIDYEAAAVKLANSGKLRPLAHIDLTELPTLYEAIAKDVVAAALTPGDTK